MRMRKWVILCCCMLCISGCSKNTNLKINTNNSVEKVMKDQIDDEKKEEKEQDKSGGIEQNDTGLQTDSNKVDSNAKEEVDYDLTEMGSDMVYATVYQMMIDPEQYVGKTFRIDGGYYAGKDERTGKYYQYCIIKDAQACCAQGLEFIWGDGSHTYPGEYPEEETEIEVQGIFETYHEENDDTTYCRLANADLKIKQ